jgi:hypothetical protein
MTTEPAPVIVRVEPVRIAGPEATLKMTGRPEDDVAESVIGASPKVALGGAVKKIV